MVKRMTCALEWSYQGQSVSFEYLQEMEVRVMSSVLTGCGWHCAAGTKELRKEGVRKASPLFFLLFLLPFFLPSALTSSFLLSSSFPRDGDKT